MELPFDSLRSLMVYDLLRSKYYRVPRVNPNEVRMNREAYKDITRGLRPTSHRIECLVVKLELVEKSKIVIRETSQRYTMYSMSHFFYIARCHDESLYVGSCHNLQERENRHNEGRGAKYTRDRRPINIIYSEEFPTLPETRRRELQVKKWSRIKKENLVAGKHPTKVQCHS